MEKVIEIKNLCKSFGEIKAVNNLSFCIRRGELFAFLGENGAGKSTTISIISGQLSKDSGEVFISGENIDISKDSALGKMGVVFQSSVLDSVLTVNDNLKCRAALYGIYGEEYTKRIEALSALLDFRDLLNRAVGKLSGGQRRRIDIARALIHSPEILILDEPTTGLDPQTRKLLWRVISDLRIKEGMTVLLTTHYMEEASEADYVVIIDKGRIAAEGTPLELKNANTGDYILLYGVTEDEVAKLGKPYTSIRDGYRVEINNTAEATSLIRNNPNLFVDYEIIKGKMDDVFLNVTGNDMKERDKDA